MLNKKLAFLVISVMLVGLLVVPSAMAAKVKIVVGEGGTVYGIEMMKLIKEAFEAQNPDIEMEHQPLVGDWVQKVTAQMVAGNAPDVMMGFGDFYQDWAQRGQFLWLNDLIEKYMTEEELNDFYPTQYAAFAVGDKQFGLPKYAGTVGLYYNMEMFDGAGVPYPTDEWTWDDLIDASKKLTKADESGKKYQWGFQVQPYLDRFAYWIWQNGGLIHPEEEVVGSKLLIDQAPAVEALQVQYDMTWTWEISPKSADMGEQNVWTTFPVGKTAMQYNGSWDIPWLLETAEFEWDAQHLAKGKAGRATMFGTDGYSIYARTKHPEEAWKVLYHIVSPEANRIRMEVRALQPARISIAREYETDSAGAKADKNVKIFVEAALNYARPVPLMKRQGEVNELLNPVLEQIFVLNKTTPEEAIPPIVKEINEMLAED